VGRIWDARRERWVRRSTLEKAVREHAYVLLGETHDNADHHRIQASLLSMWRETHPDGAIAFEQLDDAQGRVLAAHRPTRTSDVRQLIHWDQSGWPDFALYAPLIALALQVPPGPLAAHPTRDTLHQAMREQAYTPPEDLYLDPPPGEATMDALRAEIVAAHCGHAPGPMLEPMVFAQRFKDAWMARAMKQAGATAVALIAGSGHVRRDRGVPFYLARQGVNDVLSVTLRPVTADRDEPGDYEAGAYDFVVFTPTTNALSPCEVFKQQLKQMRASPREAHRSGPSSRHGFAAAAPDAERAPLSAQLELQLH